jgi:hypothetical protein
MASGDVHLWLAETRLDRLVDNWYRRATGQNVSFDIFDRFVSLWIAFNAWGTCRFDKDTDRKMVEAAKKDRRLKASFENLFQNDPPFVNDLETLKARCPIDRNRSHKGSMIAMIVNLNDFSEVLEVIYVIRCNLFHGEKLSQDSRDKELVSLAFAVLRKVFAGLSGAL